METITKTVYVAEDGKEFFIKEDCLEYEDKCELMDILNKNTTYGNICNDSFNIIIEKIIEYYKNKS
jgi:hypothetical protein